MRRGLVMVMLGLVAVATGCTGATYPVRDTAPGLPPNVSVVAHAAGLAFGSRAMCGRPSYDGPGAWTHFCHDQPRVCNIANDGQIDASVAHGDCWSTTCTVTLGAHQTHESGPGHEDFYACERDIVACTSWTGGCPSQETCVTGHGRKLGINGVRTDAWNDELYPACPFDDETVDA